MARMVRLKRPEGMFVDPVTGFTLGVAHSSCADNVQQLAAQGICLDAAFATL